MVGTNITFKLSGSHCVGFIKEQFVKSDGEQFTIIEIMDSKPEISIDAIVVIGDLDKSILRLDQITVGSIDINVLSIDNHADKINYSVFKNISRDGAVG